MRIQFLIAAAVAAPAIPAAATAQAPAAAAAPKVPFVKAEADQAVGALAKALEDYFVFPDVGKAYAAMLRSKLALGAYSNFPDAMTFALAVTADLQAVHKDGHLKFRPAPKAAASDQSGRQGPPPGFKFIPKAGWLAKDVAYIRFEGFPGNAETLAQVREFAASHRTARTLVIDVRRHRGGGTDEMDILLPEIFEKPTTLVAMDTRIAAQDLNGSPVHDPSLRTIAGPEGVVRQLHGVTPAAHQGNLARAKVYLLTSRDTVSAGEDLAFSLKRTHRATLVGETTRGLGHYGSVQPMGSAYATFIPIGRSFDPDTNEGWEGIGVAPDVAMPPNEALDAVMKMIGIPGSSESALAAIK
ncbi:MAG: S41 family peptidase [Sphingomicrobium sp.]